MIVKVKRVKKNGWLNGLKSYSGAKTRVGVVVDSQGNQVTGLTKEDEHRLEEALGHDRGYLKKGNLRDENLNNFWTSHTVDFLEDQVLVLDTEDPLQELDYLMLKAQKKVAKNMAELRTNGFAQFVIFNEEDEAAGENKRGKNKRMASNLFEELSTNDMKNILMLYGRPSDSTSPVMIENQLMKLMEDDPAEFLVHSKDPNMKSKVFVLELVKAGVLAKKGGAFVEYGDDTVIAYSMDEMVKYLDAKANNSKAIQYKEALKSRK